MDVCIPLATLLLLCQQTRPDEVNMADPDYIDVDLYDCREAAVQAAIDIATIGSTLTICRGDWETCCDGEFCPMCARVIVTEGLEACDALAAAQAYRA
ncbi:hypothetical protein PBC5_gp25 [Sinorhizobium phage PBC5]|uniref:hypothetical protein n=1 Tax=Sinorhizobium phage PBC5 TaxID=179237 RepID=UPI001BE79D85|nr:hypothetical protein PBC5_gp25 [Sinorhizobium phage PBC5]